MAYSRLNVKLTDSGGNNCVFVGSSAFPCTDNVGVTGVAGSLAVCDNTDTDIVHCDDCAVELDGDVLTTGAGKTLYGLNVGDRVWIKDQAAGALYRPFGCMFRVKTIDSATQVTFYAGHGCAEFDSKSLGIYGVSGGSKEVF